MNLLCCKSNIFICAVVQWQREGGVWSGIVSTPPRAVLNAFLPFIMPLAFASVHQRFAASYRSIFAVYFLFFFFEFKISYCAFARDIPKEMETLW